jgi:hypothetical protein
MGCLILDNEDAALLGADGRQILELGAATDTLGAALAHVRNRRSLADLKAFLAADKSLRRLLKQKRGERRWSEPY